MDTARGTTAEIVPLADRGRYMDAFRVLVVALLGVILIAAPGSLAVPRLSVLYAIAGYAALALAARLTSGAFPRVAVLAFGAMLLVDGVFLAWTGYATGSAESPLRFAILLHVVAVALLASYRTGTKLALWHSLLLVVVFYGQQGGALDPLASPGIGIGTPFQRLMEFAALFWVVAIATSAFSAVNERELRRRRYDTEALATMATELEAVTEPVEVAETLVRAVAETYDFERVLLVASRDGGDPAVLATHGQVDLSGAEVRFDASSSALAHACGTRSSVLVTSLDADGDPWLCTVLPRARNVIGVSLTAEGHSVGVLIAVQGRRLAPRIARRVLSMVERFVSHGTLALRNAWLLDQIRTMASTDGLTGVANRASFDGALAAELGRAARRAEDASLLLLDIDHFKSLNDTYGHQCGDDVLRMVGATLRDACRDFDTPARYGGEEFAVLLPATSKPDAVEVAERLRLAIAGMPSEVAVTVSVGVATFPLDATQPDAVVAAADAALYASKHGGRNRVTAAPGPEMVVQ